MSHGPRPLSGEELRQLRDASTRQARSMTGIGIALVAAGIAAFAMLAVTVLDYRFNQPFHRVFKLLGAGALGIGVLLMPWVGLFVFPIVIPYLLWIPPIPVPGMNTLNLLLGTVFASWAVDRVMKGQPIWRTGALSRPLFFMSVLVALAVGRGAAFPAGFDYDLPTAAVGAFRSIVTLAVYFVVLMMARGPRARRALFIAAVIGLALEATTTMLLGRNGKGMRAVGSIGQSNELGAFLALGAAFAFAMIPGVKNGLLKLALAAVTVAAGFGIVLSLSRASMIAIGAAVFYAAFRSSRVLTVVLVVVALSAPVWAPDYLKERVTTGSTGNADSDEEVELDNASQLRIDTWRAMLNIFQDHPFDGVGFGGLQQALPEAADAMGVDTAESSHNTFLRMLGETGIFGLALFLWLFWRMWRLASAGLRAARTKFDRQLAIGFGAAVIAFAISCAFGDRFFPITVSGTFWVMAALIDDIVHERRAELAAAAAAGPRAVPVAAAGAGT